MDFKLAPGPSLLGDSFGFAFDPAAMFGSDDSPATPAPAAPAALVAASTPTLKLDFPKRETPVALPKEFVPPSSPAPLSQPRAPLLLPKFTPLQLPKRTLTEPQRPALSIAPQVLEKPRLAPPSPADNAPLSKRLKAEPQSADRPAPSSALPASTAVPIAAGLSFENTHEKKRFDSWVERTDTFQKVIAEQADRILEVKSKLAAHISAILDLNSTLVTLNSPQLAESVALMRQRCQECEQALAEE